MNRYDLPVMDPETIPEIAYPPMHDKHKDEIDLVNEFGVLLDQAMKGDPDEAAITEKLQEWLAHTHEHFSAENKLMQECNFPAYPVHSGEHDRVLAQLEDLQQDWLKNKSVEQLADFLFVDWVDWFNQHVNSMDKITAQFISQVR